MLWIRIQSDPNLGTYLLDPDPEWILPPAIERLLKGQAGDPHPVAGADGPVRVNLVGEEEAESVLPGQPQVPPGQEHAAHQPRG